MTETNGGLRKYAAHRLANSLPGHSHAAVQRAIESGRLTESVQTVDGRVVIDFAAADAEWAARTDPTRQQRATRHADTEASTLSRLHYATQTLRQKLLVRAAQYVDVAALALEVREMVDRVRAEFNGIPDAWSTRCPHLRGDAVASVRQFIGEYLEELLRAVAELPAPVNVDRDQIETDSIIGACDDGLPPSLSEASARLKRWQACMARQKYLEVAGIVIHVTDSEGPLAAACATVKSNMLGLPAKVKQVAPDVSLQDLAALDALIRETLTAQAGASEEAAE